MLVTHDMLEKSTPVCIAFNHMPWDYLAVARLDIGGQRKHFIWKTNFKKRFEWDGSFNAQGGEMLRITLNMPGIWAFRKAGSPETKTTDSRLHGLN